MFSVATAEIPEIDGINDFDNVAITMKVALQVCNLQIVNGLLN